MKYTLVLALGLFVCAGCQRERIRDESICSAHNIPMTKRTVDVSYNIRPVSYILPTYAEIFPNANDPHIGSGMDGEDLPYQKEMYVCDKCREAKKIVMNALMRHEESLAEGMRLEKEVAEQSSKAVSQKLTPAQLKTRDQMANTIIPAMEFRQANINDVLTFLLEESIDHDSNAPEENVGVGIILSLSSPDEPEPDQYEDPFAVDKDPSPHSPVPPITLSAKNISLLDAIDTICLKAGIEYEIDRNGVLSFKLKESESEQNAVTHPRQ